MNVYFKNLVFSSLLATTSLILPTSSVFGMTTEEQDEPKARCIQHLEAKSLDSFIQTVDHDITTYHKNWADNKDDENTKPLSRLYSNFEGQLKDAKKYCTGFARIV